MTIQEYIDKVARNYASGIATEHTFRGDLQSLIESLVPEIRATNEPKRIDCGAPDYVITLKDIPVGYIEAKDVGQDLDAKNLKEQFDRYRDALDNLVFTDYLDFRFYINATRTATVRIAEIRNGKVAALPEHFEAFTSLIKEFCSRTPQTIKSSKRLAEMMADKAKILAFIIKNAIESDEVSEENSTLREQMQAFKDILIHDIDAKSFADIYAQTIAYGMFAARLHDKSLDTFSRREAAELIPKTNPFLRKLFQFIAAFDLDTRIDWIVDALADLFRATDIAAILKNFGKTTQTHDPIMHFYETFLAEYDPRLRKSRGVFYTPEPVVNFIVRAVDDILKTEFNLPQGLADTSKTRITVDVQGKLQEREVHKVQILDPATGTGTFLASVIKHIYKGFENQQGVWSNYVENHLIPRLNGFELLMASYAMAHLKLDLLLSELAERKSYAFPADDASDPGGSAAGQRRSLEESKEAAGEAELHRSAMRQSAGGKTQRFQIYLTNALEEYHPDTGTLFASWLSTEANEANHIKRDTPVMVVIGNPPYSGESANKGEWIMSLMDDYKKEPGGVEKLKEKNSKWINDDYVKFLRYGQHFIEKNGEGVLAFINPHGFLDNPTFRGMRWNLLKTYDKIYTIDLHGNSKKKEVSPDGSPDVNVFDIMQGVSINLFIKNGRKDKDDLAEVFHFDLYGKRETKYSFLLEESVGTIDFARLPNVAPNYFFVNKDFEVEQTYSEGFLLEELFGVNVLGYQTHRDGFAVSMDEKDFREKLMDFVGTSLTDLEFTAKYNVVESATWNLARQREILRNDEFGFEKYLTTTTYRPFDKQFTLLHSSICDRPRKDILRNILNRENLCLNVVRQTKMDSWHHAVISDSPTPALFVELKDGSNTFPLYLYPDNNAQQTLDGRTERVPNLNTEIVEKLAAAIGLTFVAEKEMSLKGTKIIAQGKAEGRDPGNDQQPRPDPEGVEQTAADVAPLQGADVSGEHAPGFHPGLLYSSPSATETFAPIDILDYIYAVLHSPIYRKKYKEFLKIDFPRVPYPADKDTFWQLVALGGELRQIHLLESRVVNQFITGYPVGGNNDVVKPEYKPCSPPYEGGVAGFSSPPGLRRGSDASSAGWSTDGVVLSSSGDQRGVDANAENHPTAKAAPLLRKEGSFGDVYINATQHFSNVPEIAWNFYIGGYQPAQKWLKDRKGRELNFDDIQHYQKIIVALTETDRLMKEIDKIDFID